jgi:hypothetical protein
MLVRHGGLNGREMLGFKSYEVARIEGAHKYLVYPAPFYVYTSMKGCFEPCRHHFTWGTDRL